MKMEWDSEYIEYLIKSGDFDKDSFYKDNVLRILLDCMKAAEIACLDVDTTVQNGCVALEDDEELDCQITYLKEDIRGLDEEISNLESMLYEKEDYIDDLKEEIENLKKSIIQKDYMNNIYMNTVLKVAYK